MSQTVTDDNQVEQAVFAAADETNQLLPPEKRLEKSPETILAGGGGKLDSLGIINFIVALEQIVEQQFGRPISLMDEQAMSRHDSPLATLGSLTRYLAGRLAEDQNG